MNLIAIAFAASAVYTAVIILYFHNEDRRIRYGTPDGIAAELDPQTARNARKRKRFAFCFLFSELTCLCIVLAFAFRQRLLNWHASVCVASAVTFAFVAVMQTISAYKYAETCNERKQKLIELRDCGENITAKITAIHSYVYPVMEKGIKGFAGYRTYKRFYIVECAAGGRKYSSEPIALNNPDNGFTGTVTVRQSRMNPDNFLVLPSSLTEGKRIFPDKNEKKNKQYILFR